jgi:hypothetical protein
MKITVLYRPESEHGRVMDEFVHEFQHRHEDTKLEIQDIDSRDGSAMASLYDIMQYPAILALRDDGSVLKIWEGGELPLMDEVASYAFS